ncbi:MAG: hypothetical protein J7M38_12995 [Armatimonadetes bacterium]|nr:hypothetical protein [Armatimonadota bacterium]
MRVATILALTLASGFAMAAEPATITVRPGEVIGRVNPLVFGNNELAYQGRREDYGLYGSGVWDPKAKRPQPQFVELAKQAGITVSRWPGGCATHNYNWKLTVGPLDKRPTQQWGLPEFLAWCDAVGSIPVITVAVYWGGPQDGADLVEYLNAPNDGANPNGGTDWAAVRAGDGHPEPYGVVWFEYGNESYHGEHHPTEGRAQKRVYTPEHYAELFVQYQDAMKAVDPSIKLGAVFLHGRDEWNRPVLRAIGDRMDFGILHTYIPGFRGDTDEDKYRLLMQACVACGPQMERMYDRFNSVVEEETGRTDLQWAITEYNGSFVGQKKSPPFRQALANALCNAEHLRVMMQPRHRIVMADFWQFANEYWGMVRGYPHKGQDIVKQANFYTFALYHEHFGETLVQTDVACGTWDFDGAARVLPRHGEPRKFEGFDENLLPEDYAWRLSDNPKVQQEVDGRTVMVRFNGEDTNYYHAGISLPAKPKTGYRLTGEIRTEGLVTARGVRFQIGDARGYGVTHSAALGDELRGDNDWTEVVIDYVTLADAEGITIMARRIGRDGGDDPISGTAWFRLRSVQEFQPWNAGAVPDLSVNAATRADGAVTLMVVNTNLDEAVETTIEPGRATSRAEAWSLVGESPWAHNMYEDGHVWVEETRIVREGDRWRITLPKCSLTAIELHP